MGYYTTATPVSPGVGNGKTRVEFFLAAERRNFHLPAHERPVRQGFRGVGSTTCTVGVRYYGYRYYNPELGRWINRDPIGENGGDNVYVFAGNLPMVYIDSLGLAKMGGIIDGIVKIIKPMPLKPYPKPPWGSIINPPYLGDGSTHHTALYICNKVVLQWTMVHLKPDSWCNDNCDIYCRYQCDVFDWNGKHKGTTSYSLKETYPQDNGKCEKKCADALDPLWIHIDNPPVFPPDGPSDPSKDLPVLPPWLEEGPVSIFNQNS